MIPAAGEDGAAAGAGAAPWWQPRPVLRRFVADLIQDELSRLRRSGASLAQPWPEELALEQDLGVDSLERLALAAALAESLHLHQSGIEDYLLARRSLGDWIDIADAGLARFCSELTFRTSGSSGVPKPCLHQLSSLLQEIDQLAVMFEGRQRILSAVASHHIYGFLFTILLPRALGLGPEAVIDLRGSTPAWLARGAMPGDLVIGHPDFWEAVARTVPQMPADLVGVTSTAPCPDHVSDAIEKAGIARLAHIYGSSETAGIGWRSSYRDPYSLFAHWSFSPGHADELLRRLPDGRQQARACQDRLERLGPCTFNVASRHDEGVQVGGVNVFPSRAEAALKRHPLVQDAVVRLMRPDEGTRLKAYVVPRAAVANSALLVAELRRWIDAHLTVPERPKSIRLGTGLPVTASGKHSDWDAGTGEAAQRH